MKTWETPKLIAIVRNNSQEAVLSSCKIASDGLVADIGGPVASFVSCSMQIEATFIIVCMNCSELNPS